MTSAYPDIEGQLYTTGAPDATYTEAEARQRAATAREVEAAASAAGASALTDAKAYTDQKVSPLATVASVVAGDLQSLADAKAYADGKVAEIDSLPSGGSAGQVLTRTTSGAAWESVDPGDQLPAGGTAGQVLTKTATGEVWADPEAASDIKVGGAQPASGWWLDSGNVYVPPTPDTVAPVAGTLTVTTTSSKATLTVSGASDDRALNAAAYSFSKDNGITWGGWQSPPTFEFTDLAPGTTFTFRHRTRDAEGNVTLGVGVAKATAEHVSAYRDAVLALAPSDYYPLDDVTTGPTGNTFRNIGNASPLSGTINAPGTTLGAPGIGDGATSVSLASGGPVFPTSTLAGATKFTVNVLVDIVKTSGAMFGLLWDTMVAEVTAGPGATPLVRAWADSKNLDVVTPAVVTGRHMLTFTYDGTTVRFYWDGQLAGQADPTTWTNGYPSKNTRVNLTEGRAAGLAFFRGKTLTDAQVQSLYDALPAT